MFQFSDDFDDELEDFLNVPLEGTLIQNVNTSTAVCKNTEVTLDTYDDDELILSAIENIDVHVLKETNTTDKALSERVFDIKSAYVPNKEGSETKTVSRDHLNLGKSEHVIPSISRESRISDFFKNSDAAPHSSGSKHKLMVTNNSPSTPKIPRVEYERKFPGPAGLIAKKSRDSLSSIDEPPTGGNSSRKQLDVSVTDESLFENSSWQQLLDDVNSKSSELLKVINEFSVAAVKRMNIIKHTSRKIPLFAAVIFHLDCSLPDPSVILKDPSGEIRGTLLKDIWQQYSDLLAVGSAVLLRQVSVLSIANSRKPYLNITGNNIDTIYTVRTGKSVLITRISPAATLDYLNEETKTDVKESTKLVWGARSSPEISCSAKNSKTDSSGEDKHPVILGTVCAQKSGQHKNMSPVFQNTQVTSPVLKNVSSAQAADRKEPITECSKHTVSMKAINTPKNSPCENTPPTFTNNQTASSVLNNVSSAQETGKNVQNLDSSGSLSFELEGIDADSIFGDF